MGPMRFTPVTPVVGLTLAIIAWSNPTAATTQIPRTLADLCKHTKLALEATVGAIQYCTACDPPQVDTYVTFIDPEIIYGVLHEKEVTIRLPGGIMDGRAETIVGTPGFAIGERVIVLLTSRRDALISIEGWEDGVFKLQRSGDGYVVYSSRGYPVVRVTDREVVTAVVAGPQDGVPALPEGLARILRPQRAMPRSSGPDHQPSDWPLKEPPEKEPGGSALNAVEFRDALRRILNRGAPPPTPGQIVEAGTQAPCRVFKVRREGTEAPE